MSKKLSPDILSQPNTLMDYSFPSARGFRSFANYRTRILFLCGKLELTP